MPVTSKSKKPVKKAAAKRTVKATESKSANALSDHKLLKKAAKTKLAPKPAAKKVAREKMVVQKPEKAEGRRPSARGRDSEHQYGSGYQRSNAKIALKDKGVIAEPFMDERAPASSAVNLGGVNPGATNPENAPAIPYSSSHEAGMEDMPGGLQRSGAIQAPWYRTPAPAHPDRSRK
ncbi:MAG: hypothetical protein PW788_11650 [Micavibrio sp.]|nr:hypothetical protein [Micavibrio sp.]